MYGGHSAKADIKRTQECQIHISKNPKGKGEESLREYYLPTYVQEASFENTIVYPRGIGEERGAPM